MVADEGQTAEIQRRQMEKCLCAAVSLSERILNEGAPAVADYRKFLSAGSSVPPIEALKLAGIDMNRKMLSETAIHDPAAFTALCEKAKAAK